MKNIYAILLSIFFISGAYAQSGVAVSTNHPLFRPTSVAQKPSIASRTPYQFITDYDFSDSISEVNIAGNLYDTRFAWDMNMNYLSTDSSYKYTTVVFDSVIDSYGQVSYSRNALASITMDSVHILLGQENNSGLDDTLVVKLLNVQANRLPGTTVLWADTVIFAAGAPLGANWLSFSVVSLPVGYTYLSTAVRTAIKLEYYGNTQDTAGFLAGFGYNGTCSTGLQIAYDTYMNPVLYNPSATSFPAGFNANSYVYYTAFNAQFPQTNNFIYYPCDATTGYQPGSDAFNLWQNVNIMATFTVDDGVGIHEQTANGMKLLQNSPNPFSNETTIHYSLQKGSNVSIEITDLTGRVISVINEGYRSAGNFSATFNAAKFTAGTYFYTLKTENGNLTNRMIIKR